MEMGGNFMLKLNLSEAGSSNTFSKIGGVSDEWFKKNSEVSSYLDSDTRISEGILEKFSEWFFWFEQLIFKYLFSWRYLNKNSKDFSGRQRNSR